MNGKKNFLALAAGLALVLACAGCGKDEPEKKAPAGGTGASSDTGGDTSPEQPAVVVDLKHPWNTLDGKAKDILKHQVLAFQLRGLEVPPAPQAPDLAAFWRELDAAVAKNEAGWDKPPDLSQSWKDLDKAVEEQIKKRDGQDVWHAREGAVKFKKDIEDSIKNPVELAHMYEPVFSGTRALSSEPRMWPTRSSRLRRITPLRLRFI